MRKKVEERRNRSKKAFLLFVSFFFFKLWSFPIPQVLDAALVVCFSIIWMRLMKRSSTRMSKQAIHEWAISIIFPFQLFFSLQLSLMLFMLLCKKRLKNDWIEIAKNVKYFQYWKWKFIIENKIYMKIIVDRNALECNVKIDEINFKLSLA